MKNRTTLTLACLALAFSTLQGALVESWQFGDGLDTRLNSVANDGSVGTSWNFAFGNDSPNPDSGLTDGNGLLTLGDDLTGPAGTYAVVQDYTRKATFASALTTGTFSFEVRYDNWNLTSNQGNGITFKLMKTPGGDSVNMVFDWRATDNIRTRHAVSGLTGSAAQQGGFADTGSELIVQVNGSLDTGSFTSAYSTDGGSNFTTLISDGAGLTSIAEILWSVEGAPNSWSAGEFIDVDYVQLDLTPIPEPQTIALAAGILALGFVMYRRRRA
jgi:hypothetical protein